MKSEQLEKLCTSRIAGCAFTLMDPPNHSPPHSLYEPLPLIPTLYLVTYQYHYQISLLML